MLLSHITIIGKWNSRWLRVLQNDLDSRTFVCCVWPLHMHRPIIMSHNLVTKSKKMPVSSKIGIQIAYPWIIMSKITICLSVPLLTVEPQPWLCTNPIYIFWLSEKHKCSGKNLRAKQASHSALGMDQTKCYVQDWVYLYPTGASQNQARYNYLYDEMSLVWFPIFRRQYEDTP
jgi:hypothetical protein